jgi:hypothetical protein
MAPIKLTTLAHKGDLPIGISERMEASHITDADQLYCLVRSMLNHGTESHLTRLASDLNTTVDKLGVFKDYIEPYTSPHITDPSKAENNGIGGGCLISDEQMERLKKISLMNEEEFEAYQGDLNAKYELRAHAERLLKEY